MFLQWKKLEIMSKLDKDESNASHNKEVWCATIIDVKKKSRDSQHLCLRWIVITE